MEMQNKINEFIKKERKARNLTQKKLAFYSGVGFDTVNRIERGDSVKTETLNKILKVFGYQLGVVKIEERHEESAK